MNIKNYLFLSLLFIGFLSLNAQSTPQAQILPLEKKDLFKKDAITFYMGSGNMPILDTLGDAVKKNLLSNFPEAKMNVSNPFIIGYQYHIRDKFSIGMVYCSSSVTSDKKIIPDFQNVGQSSEFYYNLALTSLMTSVDVFWKKIKRPKSTFAFHSGLSLGIFNLTGSREITNGSGNGVEDLNLNVTSRAFQLTVVGVKHSMDALKGFGWFANLGLGFNSIGLTTGINWTL
jgi:hypothetical protein